MNSLLEKKYINKILAYKKLLISELTDEFGTKYEELLNERFDKIGFIFFTSLKNLERNIRMKYSYLAAKKIEEFIRGNAILNDVYINERFKNLIGYVIESAQNEELFYKIFDTYSLSFDFQENSCNVFGIYAFDTSIDLNNLKSYAQNRKITVEEFIKNNRCDFLRNIGKYPMNYSNEMICSDANYLNLCMYYEKIMQEYNKILADIRKKFQKEIDTFNKFQNIRARIFINNYKKMLEKLVDYLSIADRKKLESGKYTLNEIDFLKVFFFINQSLSDKSKLEVASNEEEQELYFLYYGSRADKSLKEIVKKAREEALMSFNNQILQAFTFEANIDISILKIHKDISISNGENFNCFIQENGKEKIRLLFIDPYAFAEAELDIVLRHELRHALTTSIKRKNNFVVVKIGNTECIYSAEGLVTVNNEFYNELFTELKAVENTKLSFEKGIYILSPLGIPFPDNLTSIYEEYLPEFKKLYDVLPFDVKESQIKDTNDDLYSYISLEQINKLESNFYETLEDILLKFSSLKK